MIFFNNYISVIAVLSLLLLASFPQSSFCFSFSASKGNEGTRTRSRHEDTNTINSNHLATLAISIALTTASTTAILPSVASATIGDAASIDSGKVLFKQNCASCHANGENVMNPKKDLKKETLLKNIGSSAGTTDVLDTDQIVSWIEKSGQHKRLFFPNVPGGKLTHENYEDAISFIVDQAGNDKW